MTVILLSDFKIISFRKFILWEMIGIVRCTIGLMEMAKVINSGIRLIPDGFCFLDPLKELSI